MLRWVIVGFLALSACSDDMPECDPGELRYTGRPARHLFAYETSCRADCFSPSTLSCDQECGEIEVTKPAGALLGSDRQLVLLDPTSIGSDRALVHTFGYVDDAGGSAPAGWSFLAAGPATYESDVVVGTAHFAIQTSVAEITWESTAAGEVPVVSEIVGEPINAIPGRIEIERVDDRLVGRFFLIYETPKRQQQGEVLGCFDLAISDAVTTPAGAVRVISP